MTNLKSLLTRGALLHCDHCTASVPMSVTGQLPTGWIVLQAPLVDGGKVETFCPRCDQKNTVTS